MIVRFIAVITFSLVCVSHASAKTPLKVFILVGQSNMQGSAHKSTFAAIGDDPKTAGLLREILDQNGDPVDDRSGEGHARRGDLSRGAGCCPPASRSTRSRQSS